MKPLVGASIALALGSLPAAVVAQVAQTYSYDANGRLTEVTTTGSSGTNTAAYAYDDADNRTSRSQTGTTTWAALSRLPVGEDLQSHQAIVSPNGRYSLAVRASGAVELWADQSVVWSSLVQEFARSMFTVDETGATRFEGTGPEDSRLVNAYLALGDEGGLALFDSTGAAVLWRSPEARGSEVAEESASAAASLDPRL